MGACSRQPLAKGKGVHCEVESERSRRQTLAPRNTNHIRHIRWDELATQSEIQRLHRHRSVNVAGTWGESYHLTTGDLMNMWKQSMKHGRNKACHEKSAEAIVPGNLNLA